ncbi:MAG TPA: TlpA disulfide reductase family protein [Burkholderiales bacterium]|nr:TlpA disulfide reductase family protein [Burkholderiales bacterium]
MQQPNNKKEIRSGPWRRRVGLLVGLGLALGVCAFLWTTIAPRDTAPTISPTALYTTQLRSLDGKLIALGQWEGKVLLINFWATWCSPCREEIPHLIEAQKRYSAKGVEIIGIAIDTSEKVEPFSRKMGINYSIFLEEERGVALSKRLGNRAGVLPFTVIIDREGRVAFVTTGTITSEQIDEQIQKVI